MFRCFSRRRRADNGGTAMSSLDAIIQDLVIANRILAKEELVDAYGHVSIRHPDNPKRFLIACSLAPELVGPESPLDRIFEHIGNRPRPQGGFVSAGHP